MTEKRKFKTEIEMVGGRKPFYWAVYEWMDYWGSGEKKWHITDDPDDQYHRGARGQVKTVDEAVRESARVISGYYERDLRGTLRKEAKTATNILSKQVLV